MNNEARMQRMREILEAALHPESLNIIDESHKHAGHAGARGGGGHFILEITAADFAGKSLVQRHRMIYELLGDMMQSDIHALSIQARAPGEYY